MLDRNIAVVVDVKVEVETTDVVLEFSTTAYNSVASLNFIYILHIYDSLINEDGIVVVLDVIVVAVVVVVGTVQCKRKH